MLFDNDSIILICHSRRLLLNYLIEVWPTLLAPSLWKWMISLQVVHTHSFNLQATAYDLYERIRLYIKQYFLSRSGAVRCVAARYAKDVAIDEKSSIMWSTTLFQRLRNLVCWFGENARRSYVCPYYLWPFTMTFCCRSSIPWASWVFVII